METQTVYCSGCDRNVRVAQLHVPDPATATDPTAFVCLECGDHCTGAMCFITSRAPADMREDLLRSGLAPS
jgi:hypothetical protein